MAKSIYEDFTNLTDAGADANGVLSGMSDEISDLVNKSKEFGTTIPEQFKPLIQKLIDSGELLDENGNKVADMAGLTFADTPLESGIEKLDKTLKDLIKTLGVPTNPFSGWKIPDLSNLDEYGIPKFAAGVNDFAGGMAIVGEHGPELVRLPRGADVIPNSLLPSGAAFGTGVSDLHMGATSVNVTGAETSAELRGLRADLMLAQRRQPDLIAMALTHALTTSRIGRR